MKITIDDRTYEATTAVALIDEIKDMNWAANPDTDAEGYIAIQTSTYKTMVGKTLELPESDTEARAIAMFEAIDALGTWKFEREE